MKKIFKQSLKVVLIVILLFLCLILKPNPVQAGFFDFSCLKIDWDNFWQPPWEWGDDDEVQESISINDAIENENGGLFEGTIGKALGGIAQAVFNIASSDELNIGFKDYDELIFNINPLDFLMDEYSREAQVLSPFSIQNWNKVLKWYAIFTAFTIIPILIGTIVASYKIIIAGTNIQKRNDAKDSLMRLALGGVAIALAPIFVKLLLNINYYMVSMLISNTKGGLNKMLGSSMISQIRTGSAIATALVICLFAYLFVKLNIKFIIRKFTLIVFTVFTPLIVGMWIINKNVTGAAIWFGQIFINVFMQFIYAFLFLIYMSFTTSDGGWATALLWAMMILPLADVLLNCMQNLVSRVAGVNNDELANRGVGLASGMAHTIHAIGSQFVTETGPSIIQKFNNRNNNSLGVNNDISPKEKTINTDAISSERFNKNSRNTNSNEDYLNNNKTNTNLQKKKGFSFYGIGRNFMNIGMFMAEGKNFNSSNNKRRIKNYTPTIKKNKEKSEKNNEKEEKSKSGK
ncbi:MAG: hypothetical protein HFJ45_01005 [Clostridia bacterium]|nr:hypothetical protein [Clostridia bacterium]